MAKTLFSVIIPTYNDWPRLLKCLEALENQSIDRERYEVIVVNNAADQELPVDVALPESVILCYEPKPGSYAARNRGAEAAKGEILAFTDSDCIPFRGWLLNALEAFDGSDCSLLGGEIKIFKPSGGERLPYVYDKNIAFPQEYNVSRGNGVTANLFVKRSVFEALGGFRDEIKSGGDWEFTQRAVQEGYKMEYCGGVIVQHPSRKTLGQLFKKQRRLTAWGYLNTKRAHNHSDVRIFGSTVKGGFRRFCISILKLGRNNQNVQAVLISQLLYLYRIYFLILLISGFKKPELIRE